MAMRAFAGIDLAVEAVPDATTLLKLRRMLVALELTRRLFDEIGLSQGIHPRSHMIATKACPIVLRSRHGIVHILAFKHPAAGHQLVKGTIEQGESSPEAAIRELCEESGICDAHVVSDLGLWSASYQEQIWSFQLCESGAELPDEWTFETSDDGGHTFAFYWHPLQRDLPEQCHPLFQSALREVRARIGALTRSA